jgi:FMN phosphatase YigB (HAD superfamily)/ketosteroid isomerase-like protein
VAKALLFDIGDVVMRSNWDLLDDLEAITGRTIVGRGPLDPDNDPAWQRYLAGTISATDYWERIAVAAGFADRWTMWREMCLTLGGSQFGQDALDLIADARAAGVLVGALSNDLVAIGGRAWVDTRPELAGFDAFVDATELGVRKPAPAPYLAAIEQFGLPANEIVFLDDTPICVEGARAVGMIGLHVDPIDRSIAFARARELVGLGEPSAAERLVRAAQDAYQSRDLDAACALLHPDVIVHWNGELVAIGLAEARRFHIDQLGFGAGTRDGYELRKTLRSSSGDSVCVEWQSSHRRADGSLAVSRGGEFWVLRYGRVIEWHAYSQQIGSAS